MVQRYRFLVAAMVFAIAITVYMATMAPTVGLVDSGALIVAAASLGVPHPPGSPLFVMVTHLFTALPFGSMAWRANLASAFFASLACAMTALAGAEVLNRFVHRGQGAAQTATGEGLIMLAAGLMLAFSRTLWRYATITEVYPFNIFLIATIVWLMLSWRRTNHHRRLYFAAAIFGLGLGVHYVTTGLMLIATAVLVFRTAGFSLLRSRLFAMAGALAIASTIAVYAYLPMAASRDPVLNWGDPDSPERLIAHISAAQYREYITPRKTANQLVLTGNYLLRDLGPAFLPLALLLAVVGLVHAWRHDRTLFWFLVLLIAAPLGWTLVYPIRNDQDAYLLPASLSLVMAAACGGAWLASFRGGVAPMILLVPAVALAAHWAQRDRSEYRVAEEYVANTLRTLEPNALLITADWQLYSPLLYFLEIEKVRPDTKVLEYGMLIQPWYLESLQRRYPELVQPAQKQFAAYRTSLADVQRDRKEWRRNPRAQRRAMEEFDALVLTMIQGHLDRGGHVYATLDVALSRHEIDRDFLKKLSTRYGMVPRGLVVEYLPRNQQHPLPAVPLNLRGLLNAAAVDDPDDPARNDLVPVYLRALYLQGRFLREAGRFDEAMMSLRQALTLDPGSELLQRELRAAAARSSRAAPP